MELNDNQKAVVEAAIDHPAKVVAGAGTGKTRVLVERYLRFLRDGVPPSRLLALTFTLKAADEMRQRIFDAVEKDHSGLLRELYAAWIMNFHSFGFRIIRENAPAFGIDPGVDVASTADLRRIDRLLESRFLAGRIEGVPGDFGGEIPAPAELRTLFAIYLGVVKKCRGDLIPVEDLLSAIRDQDSDPYKAAVASIAAVYDAFTAEMERQNLIDFNDMIGLAASGFAANEDLAAQYRDKFDHILVDEFQDTSAAQFELLKALSDDQYSKVTVVGDEKQSIYRWRDARVENIREFPGKGLPLSDNYRSRQNILDLAHAFIVTDPDLAGRTVRLKADRDAPGKPIILFHPADEHEGQQNDLEARALAAWVVHVAGGGPLRGVPPLVGEGSGEEPVGYGGVAVLLRGVREYKVVPSIERAFQSAGIPYVILGGADAAGSRALELLHAYLSLLLPGDRRLALLHVLESKPFTVGHASLAELIGEDGGTPGGHHELLSDERVGRVSEPGARGRLELLRELLDALDGQRATADFRLFLARALEDTPFLIRLFDEQATMRSVEDLVGELWEICGTLDAKRELGLWSFLDHLRAAIDSRSFGKVEQLAVPPGHVRIMTIHQAKGLEFPAVAVAGIKPPQNDSSGFFLSKSDGVFSEKWKDWNRGYKNNTERDLEKGMRLQEERCLLYVAMTRAEDLLFVSSPYAHNDKSLFTDVLAAVKDGDLLAVEVRSTPDDVRAGDRRERSPGGTDDDASTVIREWRKANESLATQLAMPAVVTTPVQFVNWSKLETFAKCPLRYQYRHLLGFGEVSGGERVEADDRADEKGDRIDPVHIPRGVTPAEYGIVVHELLRDLMAARATGGEPPENWIAATIEKVDGGVKQRKGVVASASKLIGAFDSSDLAVPGNEARFEEPFQVRIDRTVFHGVFDRVERAPDGWVVTDYKIGQEKEEYRFQVAFYMWALQRITGGGAVDGRLCYLREGECVTRGVVASVNELDELAASLEASISKGAFPASPGDGCRTCPYSTTCPFVHR
jgi:DNA helicase-2/ATP-dependent DNA helicase PcrA